MLESIQIKNFAIIAALNLELDRGLTALTGETGAGKSILLDAIKLVAGDRADRDTVKTGQDKAEISVCFNVASHNEVLTWLQDNELGSDEECIIRRVVHANGRSKAFINGQSATLAQLKDLSQLLVDLHGQHEHQSLQKPLIQQLMLDTYLDEQALIEDVKQKFSYWKKVEQNLLQIRNGSIEREQRIDLLRLYCKELEELNLADGEVQNLQSEYKKLSHAGQLLDQVGTLLNILYDNEENTLQSLLSYCEQSLATQVNYDTTLETSHDLINNALIQVQEATNELRNYQQSIDLDPARLDWLNQRIATTQDLARKHHIDSDSLPDLFQKLKLELNSLCGSEQDQEEIERELEQVRASYLASATQLSQKRQRTAGSLSAQITEVMQELGMKGGQFSIQVDELDAETSFRHSGINTISYQVSANPGQPLKPMNKVASGGELSRISLAIQVILCEASCIPTLIFDEVDSGIGGGIAEVVGKKLRWLGENRQILCVTHLPQVASQAHQHLRVEKTRSIDDTTTSVIALNEDERLEEIARMLGGLTITDQTRAHASEMIAG
ncbi:MAG: DNA repair protein RecN [Gammaproteobacteria bacterium]